MALDFDAADRQIFDSRAAPGPAVRLPKGPDEYFHQEFVRALFERTLDAVRAECQAAGRGIQFQIFERYDVAPGEDVSYALLATEFGLTSTQVTNYLAAVRRSFRAHALEALAGLCGSRAEFRREARDLFGVEVE